MNENLIHNLKHVKECLVNKEMVGEDWEERQEVLAKLEDVVTYLNDATEESINTLGMNVVSRKNYFLKHIDPKFPHEEFTARTRVVFREIVDSEGLAVKPGAKELIMLGKEKGYRLAVATSSRRDYASRLLKEAKVYDYFDGFVFGDMVSHSKPDPEIYEKACEAIGVLPQESVAFEDAPAGIRSAVAAGLRVVAVPDLVQPPKELEEIIWMKLDTLEEMVKYIKED